MGQGYQCVILIISQLKHLYTTHIFPLFVLFVLFVNAWPRVNLDILTFEAYVTWLDYFILYLYYETIHTFSSAQSILSWHSDTRPVIYYIQMVFSKLMQTLLMKKKSWLIKWLSFLYVCLRSKPNWSPIYFYNSILILVYGQSFYE